MNFALPKWLSLSQEEVASVVAKPLPKNLSIDSQSRKGQRSDDNQDAYLVLGQNKVFAVADGMGGHAGGRIASRLAIDTLYQGISAASYKINEQVIIEAIKRGHQRIRHSAVTNTHLRGMGTTLVVAWLDSSLMHCFHVGDSRAYRWRNYRLQQLTQDHSNPSLRGGKPTLSRALGANIELEVDYQSYPYQAGDGILLCSDGISDALADYAISNILAEWQEKPEQCLTTALIDQAVQAGGTDDKTAVWIAARD